MTKNRAPKRVPNEGLMWGAAGFCVLAGLVAPLFGDSATAVTVPFGGAVSILGGIAWLRGNQAA
ncbi:hypothetical protein SUDANB120_05255 [Streptomyces sp. enrichment culture]|uniref:hypothetical protein n=1 Tax=Streptomyces TaxID=1883 RepID=UPI001678954A|nr:MULTISPECIES: hypothetical protein [Streptomyces]MBD3578871.1 hypothetical protein [Streptomyces sp. KD18]GGS80062.1 hypothetical protein GCM10010286_00580 [Streptomyces toxytricini]